MSEPTKNWSANDKVNAADLNANFIEALNNYRDFTCGTTITAGRAVCLNPSDSKIYPCDSGYNDYRTLNFVGFAVTGGSASAVIKVQISGKFAGLSGLAAGSFYFLSTAGALSTTAGTYQKTVGLAISATAIIIQGPSVEKNYVDNQTTNVYLGSQALSTTFGANTIKADYQSAWRYVIVSCVGHTGSTYLNVDIIVYKTGKLVGAFRNHSGINIDEGLSITYDGNVTLTTAALGAITLTMDSLTAHYYQ